MSWRADRASASSGTTICPDVQVLKGNSPTSACSAGASPPRLRSESEPCRHPRSGHHAVKELAVLRSSAHGPIGSFQPFFPRRVTRDPTSRGLPPMNHILVLYDSKTGNTAKMAELVRAGAATVPGTEGPRAQRCRRHPR